MVLLSSLVTCQTLKQRIWILRGCFSDYGFDIYVKTLQIAYSPTAFTVRVRSSILFTRKAVFEVGLSVRWLIIVLYQCFLNLPQFIPYKRYNDGVLPNKRYFPFFSFSCIPVACLQTRRVPCCFDARKQPSLFGVAVKAKWVKLLFSVGCNIRFE